MTIEQMAGRWKINRKKADGKPYLKYHDRARQAADMHGVVTYRWIPREANYEADSASRAF